MRELGRETRRMTKRNEIAGANAGGPRQLPMQTRWAVAANVGRGRPMLGSAGQSGPGGRGQGTCRRRAAAHRRTGVRRCSPQQPPDAASLPSAPSRTAALTRVPLRALEGWQNALAAWRGAASFNQIGAANVRSASSFSAGRRFRRTHCAAPLLPAHVADLCR